MFYTTRMSSSSPLPEPPRRVARNPRRPRRRPALTVEAIVAAAIAVLDEAGVAGLTMRRVAAELDTGAASLYAYVSGRDELLELVYDELLGSVPLPAPDPARWREQVLEMLRGLRDVLVSHRDAALAGLGRIPTSPKTLAAAEALVAALRAGGLSERVVALGFDQLVLYVSAWALEASMYEHGGMSPEEVERYFDEIHRFYRALPADRYPVLAAVAPDRPGHDGDERFEFGIEVLLSGLEALDARAD